MHYIKIEEFDWLTFEVYLCCDFIGEEKKLATFKNYEDACIFADVKGIEMKASIRDKTGRKRLDKIKNRWHNKKLIKLTKEMTLEDSDTGDIYKYDGDKWVKK